MTREFECKGCGFFRDSEDGVKIKGKRYCPSCYSKLIDEKPELADLAEEIVNSSTWQVSDKEWENWEAAQKRQNE